MNAIYTFLTTIRAKRRDEKPVQYLRHIPFHFGRYWFDYFNPSQFEDSWTVIWFSVSYGINPILGSLAWLSRKRKSELMIKGCDQLSTRYIEKDIIKTLKNDLDNDCFQLVERAWDQDLDNGQQPVIVFCSISSRIGTDIENAMRGVHGNSRVILVLLHSVLSSLLRGDLSDDEELLDPTMIDRMTGIAHFAFSDHEGLYDCHQNTVGYQKLLSLVTRLP
ncbi:uncharacterized protein LOC116308751 [Actinia tenebrosa]|uniref:Uncharacterized protein LOC116308751 n=1 Tax=Actinia tenebrosa TaxID=6105 RepID=A0A6P8JBS4_ACTTE|nr:uncharacterized protein LOC116308751 [Actinia tenebrosa]